MNTQLNNTVTLNKLPVPPRDTMLAEIVFQCLLRVGASEEVMAVSAELDKRVEEAEIGKPRPFPTDLDSAVTELYHLYADRMFMWGWNLRGNPDLLAELSNED